MPSPNRTPAAGPRASVEEPESSWNSTNCRLQKAALAEACRRLLGTREGAAPVGSGRTGSGRGADREKELQRPETKH